jgi:hypothetical protein
MRAVWALIWFEMGELPRHAAIFHLRAALRWLEADLTVTQ